MSVCVAEPAVRAKAGELRRAKTESSARGGQERRTREVKVTCTLTLPSPGRTKAEEVKRRLASLLKLITLPAATNELLIARYEAMAAAIQVVPEREATALRTKEAQGTIGVHSSVELKQGLSSEAGSIADTARICFERGLTALDRRLLTESSDEVFAEFGRVYQSTESEGKEQWSLRLPRPLYLKALVLSKERGISRSHLACLCLAVGLAELRGTR